MTFNTHYSWIFIFTVYFICSCNEVEQKQNFVFILVDDLGWTDLGYSGSTFYETPNIDQLSKNSIVFTNAYASNPVCSPTRAAIMTGQHPSRIKITDWIPGRDPKDQKLLGPQDLNELPLNVPTIAEVLHDHGYQTFFAGKWHLGGSGYFPEDQGFDFNYGGHHMGQPPGGYYSPYKNPKLTDGPEGEYLTDRLTNESINFLENSAGDPFLLLLSYYTVHTPIQPSRKHIDKFEQKLKMLHSNEVIREIDKTGLTTMNQVNADYASMVYALDENVGRLIQKLKDENLYDHTTIIFTSDNGGLSTLDTALQRTGPTSVRPLRGGKGWLYEGGIRIPLLIKPAYHKAQNYSTDVPVVSHDFYPTILKIAKLEIPENHKIDGIDLAPVLSSNAKKLKRPDLFWDYPHYHGSGWRPGGAMRSGDWKLIEFYETNEVELYNLKDDLSEENNLSEIHPDLVIAMKKRLQLWRDSLQIQRPTLNPEF